jgi:hypothetical protein
MISFCGTFCETSLVSCRVSCFEFFRKKNINLDLSLGLKLGKPGNHTGKPGKLGNKREPKQSNPRRILHENVSRRSKIILNSSSYKKISNILIMRPSYHISNPRRVLHENVSRSSKIIFNYKNSIQ